MKPQTTIGRGVQTSVDVLAMLSGARNYGGADLKTSAMYEQQIPTGFQPLADELRGKLKLLQLQSGATRDAIYAAYQGDIMLLNSRRDGFIVFIKAGIRASIIRVKELANESTFDVSKDVEMQWTTVEKGIPLAGKVPFIEFSADHAALGEAELLTHLQKEANAAVERLLKLVCLWLDTLVAKEFVGLVQFTSGEAARYHYFRPQVIRETVKKINEDKQIGFDPTAPFGEQTIYEKTSGEIIKITTNLERHDHDIVNARTHSVEEYPDRMPQRVCDFLAQTPAWLRKHLVVVSGVITMECVRRRIVATEEVGEIVTSVYKQSPAIALGSYAPIGWSGDDLKREATAFFLGQKARDPAVRNRRLRIIGWIAASVIAVASLTGFIWWQVAESSRLSAEAYQTYYDEVTAGRQVLMVEKSDVLYNYQQGTTIVPALKNKAIELPGGQPLYYLGKVNSGEVKYTFSSDPKEAWRTGNRFSFSLSKTGPKSKYGVVDLGPDMGIPAKMNVLFADDTIVQFTIDYYIK